MGCGSEVLTVNIWDPKRIGAARDRQTDCMPLDYKRNLED